MTSIGGEWRYVDCIAQNAGKGRAMVYLSRRFGISLEDVVAAGDSGNDLLMLGRLPEGNHPAIVMSNSHPEVRAGGERSRGVGVTPSTTAGRPETCVIKALPPVLALQCWPAAEAYCCVPYAWTCAPCPLQLAVAPQLHPPA